MSPVSALSTPLPTPAPSPTQAAQTENSARTSPSSTPLPAPTITAALLEEHRESSKELIYPRYEHDAVLLDDGRVMLGGGNTGFANNNLIVPWPLGLVELYDPEADVWTVIEPLAGPGVYYSFLKLTDGRVLALGIDASEDIGLASMAAVFDPTTNLWSELEGSPFTIRAFPDAFLLGDGRVLVVGGVDFITYLSSDLSAENVTGMEIFNPATEEWQRAASPSSYVRPEHSLERPIFLQLADGRVAALGIADTDERRDAPYAEIYDPSADTWEAINSLDPLFHFYNGVALTDGRLLVQGEISEFSPFAFVSGGGLNLEFRTYNPDADAWAPAGETVYPRPLATLTLLADGRVLAAGGEPRSTGNNRPRHSSRASPDLPYSTTEVYDPHTNSWSLGPDLTEVRYGYGSTATLLLDGRVLLVGGISINLEIDEIYALSTSEIVDPNAPPGTGLR